MKPIIMRALIGYFPSLHQILMPFSIDNVEIWVKIC